MREKSRRFFLKNFEKLIPLDAIGIRKLFGRVRRLLREL